MLTTKVSILTLPDPNLLHRTRKYAQEYIYSRNDKKGWNHGTLHKFKIVLSDPSSNLAALRSPLNDIILICYQGRFHDPLLRTREQ